MSPVQLFDRDGQHEAAAAGFMRPHTFDLGDARGCELIPYRAAAVGAEVECVVIWRHRRDGAHEDRIVAVHHGGDADGRLQPAASGVIAGPFPKWTLIDLVAGIDEAFECDLRVRGDRQSRARHVEDLDRLAEYASRRLDLALAVGHFEPRQHEEGGMHACDHRDGAGLAALVILVHDEAAVLAGRHHDACDSGPLALDAIATVIGPAGIRILHHHHARSSDEGAAVKLVPDRRRDFLDVDLFSFLHVFQQGTAVDILRLEAWPLAHLCPPQWSAPLL